LGGYAAAVRHASAFMGLLAAVVLSWASERAEAVWRAHRRPCTARRGWSSALVLTLCVVVGLAVVIWPHALP
jgi:hypothetical protein